MIHTTTQMNLKIIMLSYRNQAKKAYIPCDSIWIVLENAN